MPKYLIDASVLHGWVNTKDTHHGICRKFFKKHEEEHLYFSIHSLFEVHAACSRRTRDRSFTGLRGKYTLHDQRFIDVDRNFYDECQRLKLFEEFANLKGSDLIYACHARIGGFTIVTCDQDFDQYNDKIDVLRLSD